MGQSDSECPKEKMQLSVHVCSPHCMVCQSPRTSPGEEVVRIQRIGWLPQLGPEQCQPQKNTTASLHVWLCQPCHAHPSTLAQVCKIVKPSNATHYPCIHNCTAKVQRVGLCRSQFLSLPCDFNGAIGGPFLGDKGFSFGL